MALASGTRLGPYEIQSPLGAGGMGEVYRAVDTRLDRTVAIKILPSHLSENVEAKQRFDREARTISSLNHPNICTLHDIGHQDGMDYLVMECLEGETLADRLRKGALPIDQVLKFGIEICDGLDRAHRSGVIHRDLKPGNIMLTRSGAKLMDFGLAKAAVVTYAAESSSGMTQTMLSPASAAETVVAAASEPLTARGSVVGTFNYMAPEQVEGKDAGPRSDIFALGAVLYEMATGKRAFDGKTAASAMAAVMEREPAPISSVQPAVPPAFERLVKSCLAKDPDDRWQTVHDVKLQLRQIAEGGSQITATAPALAARKRSNHLAWIVASLLGLVAICALALAFAQSRRALPVLRVEINPPASTTFNISGDNGGPAALSPDGRMIVFSASAGAAVPQLYVRSLDSAAARPLPGTDSATFPFWSPDGRSVGFFLPDKLMRIDIDGGAPLALCPALLGRGGSWNAGGTIIAALRYNSGIAQVSANGGQPTEITHVDNNLYSSHRWPWFLPDGKHFLYVAVNHEAPTSSNTGVFYASLDGKENRMLFPTLASAIFAAGHLLFMRDKTLLAQPFDPSTGKTTADAEPLGESVQYDTALWRMNLSASSDGMLVYASSSTGGSQRIVWVDRTGKQLEQVLEPAAYRGIALSPDGKKLAITLNESASPEIWIYDFASKQKSRLTYSSGTHMGPSWSPDSRQVAFVGRQGGDVLSTQVGGGSGDQTVVRTTGTILGPDTNWSPDGKNILFSEGRGLALHLWVESLTGDRTPHPYTDAGSNVQEYFGRFSPDGRWVAYTSTEQGVPAVFVAPFPWTGARWQVSTGAANNPEWRGDGKEIFYYNYSGITAAQVDGSGSQFEVGASKQLFPLTLNGVGQDMVPSRDGQKLLFITSSEMESQPLTLVQNWTASLKRK